MTTDVSLDELGPVDYLVVEFPAGASSFTGEMAAEPLALVDSGTIRVIDVLILTKNEDGTVRGNGAFRYRRTRRATGRRGPAGGAVGRGRRRAPGRCDGAGEHCWGAHLGEPMGCAIRRSSAALGRPIDRQRTHSYSGDHRLNRGRRSACDERRLKMPLRPARVGRVGVIGAPVAKTAVVAAAVTPGPSPVAKTAVVAAAVTPGRGVRRRI
jgi:hypothetical protein